MPNKIAGLSLVELMVATGIVGILTMVALPRFYSFIAQARRGEAKSNLAHIASLQSVYKLEYYVYYAGDAMTSNNGIGYQDGHGNPGRCDLPSDDSDAGLGNHLGFKPEDCDRLRYFYQMRGGTAVASAASNADGRYIYPNCSGAGPAEFGYTSGDALSMAMDADGPTVRRNIAKYCPTTSTAETVSQAPCVCTGWQGSWTPTRSGRSVCEQVAQTRNLTRTCSGHCPSSLTLTKTETRNVNGSEPVTASTSTSIAPCHCDVGNETRSACATCSCTTSTTAWTPAKDQSDLYTCECVEQTRQVTRTCTPNSSTCRSSTTTETQRLWGNKNPGSDANVCTAWSEGDWGACVETSSGSEICERRRTKTRTCTNPCKDTNVSACTYKSLTYQTLQAESQACICPQLEDRCASDGFLSGEKISDAQRECGKDGGIFGTSGTGDSVVCSCTDQCERGHGAGSAVAEAQASCQGQGTFSKTTPHDTRPKAHSCTCTPTVHTEGALVRLYKRCVERAYFDAISNDSSRKTLLAATHDCTDGENVADCDCDQINAIESGLRETDTTKASEFLTDIKTEMINQNGNMEGCHQDSGNNDCGVSGSDCCNVTTFLDGE